jgi:hypothetical protein
MSLSFHFPSFFFLVELFSGLSIIKFKTKPKRKVIEANKKSSIAIKDLGIK